MLAWEGQCHRTESIIQVCSGSYSKNGTSLVKQENRSRDMNLKNFDLKQRTCLIDKALKEHGMAILVEGAYVSIHRLP